MSRGTRWSGRAWLVLAAAGAVVTALVAPGAAAAAEPKAASGDNTSWVMRGDAGDYISQGREWSYDDGISASGSAGSVRVQVASWQAWFDAPAGEALAPGTYGDAVRSPFQEAGPGLSIFGDGRGCNELTGSFTVHEVSFDDAGQLLAFSVSFEQHCEGGAPALYGSIAWHASDPAWPVQPTVTLTAPTRPIGYGKRVTLVARLSPDSPVRDLSLFARVDGAKRLVHAGPADADGVLRVAVSPKEATTYVVELDGQGLYADASDTARVKVRARVVQKPFKYERKDGRYYLFKTSKNAYMATKVSPNHAGDCVVFVAEFHVEGSWQYPSRTKCVALNADSVAAARLVGHDYLAGIPIRFHVVWAGDRRNAAATSAWTYAKFVRGGAARSVSPRDRVDRASTLRSPVLVAG